MKRARSTDAFFWAASFVVIAALLFGLDEYQRQPLRYGYGPDRRALFQETLSTAEELEQSGSYTLSSEEFWHLHWGWEDEEGRARPRIAGRRGIFLLPVSTPRPLVIDVEALPLPDGGGDPADVEIEYGVNGEALGTRILPAEGGSVRFEVAPSSLFRGDNTVYLYRASRRADPSPWLRVGAIHVRRE